MGVYMDVAQGLLTYFGDTPRFQDWVGVTVKESDEPKAQVLLATVIARVMGEVHQQWEIATDIPEELLLLIFQVAARFWKSPNRTLLRQAAGPYSEAYNVTPDGIYFTKEERTVLSRHGAQANGLKTISTVRDIDPQVAAPMAQPHAAQVEVDPEYPYFAFVN